MDCDWEPPRRSSASSMELPAVVVQAEMIASSKDIAARVEKLERGHERTAFMIEGLVEDIDRPALEVQRARALLDSPKRKVGFDL